MTNKTFKDFTSFFFEQNVEIAVSIVGGQGTTVVKDVLIRRYKTNTGIDVMAFITLKNTKSESFCFRMDDPVEHITNGSIKVTTNEAAFVFTFTKHTPVNLFEQTQNCVLE